MDQLAAGWRRLGLQPGDRVALFLGNRPELLLAALATMQLGAIVVPINLAYRKRELLHLLHDAQPRLLFTEESQLETLAELTDEELGSVEELVLAETMNRWFETDDVSTVAISGDDLAMLMYTSGTTGPSKGARITHDNLVSTISGLLTAWDWSPRDRLLLTLPLFHTHGLVVGCLTALAAGATVQLFRKFEVQAVWTTLLEGEVTLFFGVPTLYHRLLSVAESSQTRFDLSHLRLLCSGSAPLPAETHQAFEALTGAKILERYGMTETGMNLSNPYAGPRIPGTVGTPLPGVSVRIVGPDGSIVDPGERGALQIRGPNVFDGYWQAPEKTQSSFISDDRGRQWFVTGDLARCDPETGHYTLLGRSTELIISGGFNIYPREIEEVLCSFPGISEAAVIGRPSEAWGEEPIAFVVSQSSFAIDDLVAFCRRQIASFKVPKEIRPIEALPRNALGKVQKHRLPR